MTYLKAHKYLNSFINYEHFNLYPYRSSFRLERMRKLLSVLDSPQLSLRVIHVAGSKGKGSTCCFTAHILKTAGFKVGLYTSPHLIDVRERIKILQRSYSSNNEKISKRDFAKLVERIRPAAEKLKKTKLGALSYYEILTALAFLYFKEQNCDFVVLETGIGGRLDATNTASSLVCAITPISYEHTKVLGSTLEKIAHEKSAIIKQRSQIAIIAPQSPQALKVIKRRAKKAGVELREIGRNIRVKEKSATLRGQAFDLQGVLSKYSNLKISLLGKHQLVNAAVGVASVEALKEFGFRVPVKAIKEGLNSARWPGRLEVISQRPTVIIDAAHNQASAKAAKEALAKLFKFRRLILVLGTSCDKDIKGILKELVPIASSIILTKTKNPRAMRPEVIKPFIKANKTSVILTNSSSEALKIARQNAEKKDLILICGSLYLLGEILKHRS